MKANIYNKEGNKIGNLDLPEQFNETIREDLIDRAFLAIRANKRQSYGTYPHAGERTSAKLSRRRRDYRGSYGKAISRAPRKILWKRGSQFGWVGSFAPGTYKGRRANPPKGSKIHKEKINIKENRKAIRCALSAVINEKYVKERGHLFKELPIILDNDIYNLKKTKDLKNLLIKLGLEQELERLDYHKVRAGQGSKRGRKYKNRSGPLFIIAQKRSPVTKILNSIKGIDYVLVNNINVEVLAPGGVPGRLTIFTKDSLETLKEKKLFLDVKQNKSFNETSSEKVSKK